MWVPAGMLGQIVPTGAWWLDDRGTRTFRVFARLADGVTFDAARAEVESFATFMAKANGDVSKGMGGPPDAGVAVALGAAGRAPRTDRRAARGVRPRNARRLRERRELASRASNRPAPGAHSENGTWRAATAFAAPIADGSVSARSERGRAWAARHVLAVRVASIPAAVVLHSGGAHAARGRTSSRSRRLARGARHDSRGLGAGRLGIARNDGRRFRRGRPRLGRRDSHGANARDVRRRGDGPRRRRTRRRWSLLRQLPPGACAVARLRRQASRHGIGQHHLGGLRFRARRGVSPRRRRAARTLARRHGGKLHGLRPAESRRGLLGGFAGRGLHARAEREHEAVSGGDRAGLLQITRQSVGGWPRLHGRRRLRAHARDDRQRGVRSAIHQWARRAGRPSPRVGPMVHRRRRRA